MRRILCLTFFCWIIIAATAAAQDLGGVAPGAEQERARETLEYYRLEKRLQQAPKPDEKVIKEPDAAPKEMVPETAPGESIFIRSIETDASEILSREEIRRILQDYEGRRASLADLFGIVDLFNDLYREKGFITARAILPPQQVKEGIVRIRLVEGRLGKIIVAENRTNRESYYRKRISLENGDLLRVDVLEKNIVFFNRTNDAQIRAELSAGEAFGTTDCVIRAEEPLKIRMTLFADNAGREETGQERIGAITQINSAFGYGDPLVISMLASDGSQSLAAVYEAPVNTLGTRIGAIVDSNSNSLKHGDLGALDINGRAQTFGGFINHPFQATRNFKLEGFAGFYEKYSKTKFGEIVLTETRVHDVVAGFSFQINDSGGIWFSRHEFTRGNESIAREKNFFRYKFSLTRVHQILPDIGLMVRTAGQMADSNLLPASEQFQLGGMTTVRGYPEGLLLGDDGYFAGVELNFPLFPAETLFFGMSMKERIKGFTFFDHGGAFAYKGANQSIDYNDFLTSAGIGLNVTVSRYLSGRVSWGIPLSQAHDNLKDSRIHFYFQSEIF